MYFHVLCSRFLTQLNQEFNDVSFINTIPRGMVFAWSGFTYTQVCRMKCLLVSVHYASRHPEEVCRYVLMSFIALQLLWDFMCHPHAKDESKQSTISPFSGWITSLCIKKYVHDNQYCLSNYSSVSTWLDTEWHAQIDSSLHKAKETGRSESVWPFSS